MKYLLVLAEDEDDTRWHDWPNGRSMWAFAKRSGLTLVEVDAENDAEAASKARAYDVHNCGGIPSRPSYLVTMYRVDEVAVDGGSLRAAILAEKDAERRADADRRDRETYERLRARFAP